MSTPFTGTFLLEDGESLVAAVKSGDWVSGGMAAFGAAMDIAATVSDPLGSLVAAGLGWVMEHLEPLKTWLDQLTGDAGQVAGFSGTWGNISTQMTSSADELVRILKDVDPLDGEAIAAYLAFQSDVEKHLRGAGTWASAMSIGLEIASTIVKMVHDLVRDAIAQIVGAVVSYAAELVVSVGLATPLVIEQVTTRVASLATRVGKSITRLLESGKELTSLLRQLKKLFEDAGELFAKILKDDTGSVTIPGRGNAPTRVPKSTNPVHSREASGDGWKRVPTTQRDPDYGLPRADSDHWRNPNSYDPETQKLVNDPTNPLGKDENGNPLDQDGWDSRYTQAVTNPDGTPGTWLRYPPDGGAVEGSRVAYDSTDAFIRDNGSSVDRVGDPTGNYLGVKVDGQPASLEERGLPYTNVEDARHDYSFTGKALPEGWTIHVSEAAPAFGHDGGAIQVQVMDARNNKVPVEDLIAGGLVN
jgi:Tuberculosis necrotizing toxin